MVLAMSAADLAQGRLAEALPWLAAGRAVIVCIPKDDATLPGDAVYVASMVQRGLVLMLPTIFSIVVTR